MLIYIAILGEKLCLWTRLMRKENCQLWEIVETRWRQSSQSSVLHKTSSAIVSKCYLVNTQYLKLRWAHFHSISSSSPYCKCEESKRKKIHSMTYSLWIIYLAQEIATVFAAQGEISKSFHKSCLLIPQWRWSLQWEGKKQSQRRLLKTLQVKCWVKQILPSVSETFFRFQLSRDHSCLTSNWCSGIVGKHVNFYTCLSKAKADIFTQLPMHMYPLCDANVICKMYLCIRVWPCRALRFNRAFKSVLHLCIQAANTEQVFRCLIVK